MVLHRNPAHLFDGLSFILHAAIHEKQALSARRYVIETVRSSPCRSIRETGTCRPATRNTGRLFACRSHRYLRSLFF